MASLDPFARREFLQLLMEAVAEQELSVVLSSHVVSDLERVCDHVVVLVDAEVRLAGDVETLLDTHHRLTGPRRDRYRVPRGQQVVSARHTDRQSTLVVRTDGPILDPAWSVSALGLEDLVLVVHGTAGHGRHGPGAGGAAVIWLSWRQFRLHAMTAVVAVAAVAVVLAVTGPRLADLAAAGAAQVFDRLTPTDITLFWAGVILVAVVPAVVGAFWGAPLVARELEAGTHRLAWTQSVTRTRWLGDEARRHRVAAAVAVGAITLAVTWWSAPSTGSSSSTRGSLPGHLTPVSFAMRGVVPVAYAVFAVVLGVTLGAVLRRPIPAMALTLALYVVVQVAVPLWVRPHLVAADHRDRRDQHRHPRRDQRGRVGRLGSITVHTADRGDWILSNETLDARGSSRRSRPG